MVFFPRRKFLIVFWITGHLFGNIWSHYSSFLIYNTLSVLTGLGGIIFYFVSNSDAKRASLLFTSGFFWSSCFSAPSDSGSKEIVKVVHFMHSKIQINNVMVKKGTNYYLVRGWADKDAKGLVKRGSSTKLFSGTKGYFVKSDGKMGFSGLEIFSKKIKIFLKNKIKKMPNYLQIWFGCLLIGEFSSEAKEQLDDFKILGLLHVLIVSGLHISILGAVLRAILFFPLIVLLCSKGISPRIFLSMRQNLEVLLVFILFLYSYGTGLNQAAQRAYIVFLVNAICAIYFSSIAKERRIQISVFLHSFVFPLGFWDSSTILSWVAYGIFISSIPKSFSGLAVSIIRQALLTIFVAALFGSISFAGIFLNPLIVPLMPFLMTVGLFLVLFCDLLPSSVVLILVGLHERLLATLAFTSAQIVKSGFLFIDIRDLLYLRWLLFFVGIAFCLNIMSPKTIRAMTVSFFREKKYEQ